MPQGIGGRKALPTQRCPPSQSSHGNRPVIREPVAASEEGKQGKKRKREAAEVDQENQQASASQNLKTMTEQSAQEGKRKRQQAKLEKQELEEEVSREDGTEEDAGSEEDGSEGRETEDGPEQDGQHDLVGQGQNVSTRANHSAMSAQERKWWAMNFDELYQYARSKNFGKTGKEGRKSGRVKIIKWLCEKEGIKPYVAPSITPVEASPIDTRPSVRSTGAISHPEAVLRTTDPALQRLIDEKEEFYKKKPAADLLKLSMERSYQLFRDSNGKLPSKSIATMSAWLAAWDVLKSPREKNWWLGDGIDLVNKAKAMGYQGSSKKYDVIVWLRSTPEDAEVEVTEVAEPTPNKKRDAKLVVSKRHAKGSTRARYD
jgi:hypothetical protein